MKRSDYRAAFDAIPFDDQFQRRTIQALRQDAGQRSEKESIKMKKKGFMLALAAAAAVLTVSAAAAAWILSPREVARYVGNDALAAAFEAEGTVVNETHTVGDYSVTLMGLVSGKGLSGVMDEIPAAAPELTYAVLSVARTDGTPITDNVPDVTVTPLVKGCAPWEVNAWTLSGSSNTFAKDGVQYYLLTCAAFGRESYLAVYPGAYVPPDASLFTFDADGNIGVQPGQDVAMFTLPLE